MPSTYVNHAAGTLSADPGLSGTTVSSSAFADLPAIASPSTMWLVLDADGSAGNPEICQITAHTAAATSVTVLRGQQSSTARTHAIGTDWTVAVTKADLDELPFRKVTTKGDILAATGANVITRKGVGTDGYPLVARSSDSTGIAYEQLTSTGLGDNAVTSAKIQEGAVTTAKIGDASVTDVKLASNSVTTVKMASPPKAISATGSAGTSSGTTELTAVTLSVPSQAANGTALIWAHIGIDCSVNNDVFLVQIKDGSTVLGQQQIYGSTTARQFAQPTAAVATTAGASKSITLTVTRSSGTGTATVYADETINSLRAIYISS